VTLRGVGIDIADPRRFARLLDRGGEAFLRRWFTDEEVAQCSGAARALAARWAGKEAVWKALGPEGWTGPLPWRDIAILDGAGRADVLLTRAAAELAHAVGVVAVEVSLSPGGPGRPALAIAIAGLGHPPGGVVSGGRPR
jgi:holo-[acyl-carrier protein] synthase